MDHTLSRLLDALRHADLREADLCRVDMRGACLRGANLTDAVLDHADLRGVTVDDDTILAPKWELVRKLVNLGGQQAALLAAMLAVALAGAFVDTARGFVASSPEAAELRALLFDPALPSAPAAPEIEQAERVPTLVQFQPAPPTEE